MRPVDILIAPLSWLLGTVLPKDRRLAVFGGRHYGGNTAPVFERCAEVGLRGVWLTSRPEILALERPGVVDTRSWRGLWLAARAGSVVLTHSLGDFIPLQFSSRRTRLYNLWHGMPIKRISTQDPGFASRPNAKSNLREMRRYRSMFVTSDAMADIFARTFGLPAEQIIRSGQPRTDVIFAGTPPELGAAYDAPLPPHRRRVLYCPTWREGTPVRLFPFDDGDLERLQSFLEETESVMFVRTHPNDPGRLAGADRRIVPMQSDVVAEVTEALPLFDVLVTDYSSVYYDYLLLDRPVIFLPYDLDEYAESPGFYIPFSDIAAGPCPATQEAFIEALSEAFEHPEAHADERARVSELVYGDRADAHGTRRVLEFMANDLGVGEATA